jgi:hypothetical protein
MRGHDAKPKACAQKRKLGAEVGKAPDSRDLETESGVSRDIGRIDVHKLNVFGEDRHRNPPAVRCKRVLWRNDHGQPNRQQRFVSELRWRQRLRSHDADRAASIEHGLDYGTRLDVESEQRGRKFLLKCGRRTSERCVGKHHVDGDAHFRFKAADHTLRPHLEEVHVACHGACVGEKRAASIRERRKMSAPFE